MNKAFSKLTRRKKWPGVGWIRSLEVTRGADGTAHPHFHVLLFVRPGYFSRGYISQAQWRELWQSCCQLNYLPVVNIKRVKAWGKEGSDLRIAILETLKYGVKPEDLIQEAEWLYGLTIELHKVRAVSVGGELKKYLKESEPEDLIHDESVDPSDIEALEHYPAIVFDYLEIVRRYARKAES